MGTHTLGWPQSSPLWSVCTAGDTGVLQSCQHHPPPPTCASRPSTPVRIRYPHIQITIRSFTSSAYRLKLPEHEAQRHSGEINEFFLQNGMGQARSGRQLQQSVTQMTVGTVFRPFSCGKGAGAMPGGSPRGHPTPGPTPAPPHKVRKSC